MTTLNGSPIIPHGSGKNISPVSPLLVWEAKPVVMSGPTAQGPVVIKIYNMLLGLQAKTSFQDLEFSICTTKKSENTRQPEKHTYTYSNFFLKQDQMCRIKEDEAVDEVRCSFKGQSFNLKIAEPTDEQPFSANPFKLSEVAFHIYTSNYASLVAYGDQGQKREIRSQTLYLGSSHKRISPDFASQDVYFFNMREN